MEYYTAINKNEMLPLMTTWADLEGIMLSEVSQRERERDASRNTYTHRNSK